MSKRKPVHPIKRMQMASRRMWSGVSSDWDQDYLLKEQRIIQRHIKPLLYALELAIMYMPTERNYEHVERVLSAWRAKL